MLPNKSAYGIIDKGIYAQLNVIYDLLESLKIYKKCKNLFIYT